MCGFAGFLKLGGDSGPDHQLQLMANAIIHRGPDNQGIWHDQAAGIGLAHRRLSIIDLSQAGHQPMLSASGRFVISYNGEIYNHLDIRNELMQRGFAGWRGHSDTETLLAGFDLIGVEETLKLAVGMFAFALWDRETQMLMLARDRLGEKPLYYGWQGRGSKRAFLFGSDLAALRQHASFEGQENPIAVREYLRFGYVPTPHSIYIGIQKLGPGQVLRVSLTNPDPSIFSYWDRARIFSDAPTFEGSPTAAVDRLEEIASKAVGRQMMADVPLGAFLSGGVDSSTVVALMQAQSDRPIKTYSIGFGDPDHNEAIFAASVAKYLRTDHHELYVTPAMALDVVPKLASIYSEPFADSSQIPVYLVSQLARQSVTVALSGDGGDELFAGYNRYILTARYYRMIRSLPSPLRNSMASLIGQLKPQHWHKIERMLKGRHALAKLSEKVPKIQKAFSAQNADELYRNLVSLNVDPVAFLRSDISVAENSQNTRIMSYDDPIIPGMMACDLETYLPDDILCKVDRAAMAVSLETRVPFLDHELVEFAWSLPMSLKLREGTGKWVLRQLLYRHVPKELIDRPKMGFSVPIDAWLRGPLKAWAEDLIFRKDTDLLNDYAVRAAWSRHTKDGVNLGSSLWPILMYRAWRQ